MLVSDPPGMDESVDTWQHVIEGKLNTAWAELGLIKKVIAGMLSRMTAADRDALLADVSAWADSLPPHLSSVRTSLETLRRDTAAS
jgi:hypothetical protein